jgi:hypothetical protein
MAVNVKSEALPRAEAPRPRRMRVVAAVVALAIGLSAGLWWYHRHEQRREAEANALRLRSELEFLGRRIQEVSAESRQLDAALAREPALAKSQLEPASKIERSVARLERRAALADEHANLLDQLDKLAPRSAGELGPKRRRVAEAQIEFCGSLARALQVLQKNDQAWRVERDAPSFLSDGPESAEFTRQMSAARQSAQKLAVALDSLNSALPAPESPTVKP